MTNYRMKYYGDVQYLEYEIETKFLFWTFSEWKLVPKPYYDIIFGRKHVILTPSCLENIAFVPGKLNGPAFKSMWPDINEYFKNEYDPKQKKLEENAKLYWKNNDPDHGKVTLL